MQYYGGYCQRINWKAVVEMARSWLIILAGFLAAGCTDSSAMVLRCNFGTDGTLYSVIRLEPSAERATLLYDSSDEHYDPYPARRGTVQTTDLEYRVRFPVYTRSMDDSRPHRERIETYADAKPSDTLMGWQSFTINRVTRNARSYSLTDSLAEARSLDNPDFDYLSSGLCEPLKEDRL